MATLDTLLSDEIREAAKAVQYAFDARSGGVLLPYQQEWVADQSSVKIAEKSRRVGLTWAEAADASLTAAAASGMDVWYIGYNKDMAVEFILDVAQWTVYFGEAAEAIECGEEIYEDGDDRKSVLTYSIRFASGNRVTALSSRPANLRGKQGKVIIDEAAFHPSLAELLKAAFALLIWGGKVSVISTHDGVDNPFNELILETRAGHKPYSLHFIDFKRAIAEGLYRRVCLRTGKTWSAEDEAAWEEGIRAIYRPNDAEELDCIPSQSAGAYFSRALIEARMHKGLGVLRLALPDGFEVKPRDERESYIADWLDDNARPVLNALPKNLTSYYGMDFARNGDLSVIWPLCETTGLQRFTPCVIEMRNVPFEQQRQILFFVIDHLPNFSGGANDARGNGQYLAEVAMQEYGAEVIQRVMLTQEWYRENMPKYKASYEDGTITIPSDEAIMSDHRAVQMVNGVPKVPENAHTTDKASGGQRHGDAAIAGCLADFAARHPASPLEFQSDGPRAEHFEGFF